MEVESVQVISIGKPLPIEWSDSEEEPRHSAIALTKHRQQVSVYEPSWVRWSLHAKAMQNTEPGMRYFPPYPLDWTCHSCEDPLENGEGRMNDKHDERVLQTGLTHASWKLYTSYQPPYPLSSWNWALMIDFQSIDFRERDASNQSLWKWKSHSFAWSIILHLQSSCCPFVRTLQSKTEVVWNCRLSDELRQSEVAAVVSPFARDWDWKENAWGFCPFWEFSPQNSSLVFMLAKEGSQMLQHSTEHSFTKRHFSFCWLQNQKAKRKTQREALTLSLSNVVAFFPVCCCSNRFMLKVTKEASVWGAIEFCSAMKEMQNVWPEWMNHSSKTPRISFVNGCHSPGSECLVKDSYTMCTKVFTCLGTMQKLTGTLSLSFGVTWMYVTHLHVLWPWWNMFSSSCFFDTTNFTCRDKLPDKNTFTSASLWCNKPTNNHITLDRCASVVHSESTHIYSGCTQKNWCWMWEYCQFRSTGGSHVHSFWCRLRAKNALSASLWSNSNYQDVGEVRKAGVVWVRIDLSQMTGCSHLTRTALGLIHVPFSCMTASHSTPNCCWQTSQTQVALSGSLWQIYCRITSAGKLQLFICNENVSWLGLKVNGDALMMYNSERRHWRRSLLSSGSRRCIKANLWVQCSSDV